MGVPVALERLPALLVLEAARTEQDGELAAEVAGVQLAELFAFGFNQHTIARDEYKPAAYDRIDRSQQGHARSETKLRAHILLLFLIRIFRILLICMVNCSQLVRVSRDTALIKILNGGGSTSPARPAPPA